MSYQNDVSNLFVSISIFRNITTDFGQKVFSPRSRRPGFSWTIWFVYITMIYVVGYKLLRFRWFSVDVRC